MTNGIRKVRKGVDIFDKTILDSCKFILDSASFPRSWQSMSINQYHSAWCTIYQDSALYVSIILVFGKRVGEDREGVTLPSLHYYFLFSPSRVYCHVISHRFSLATRNHDCSELPLCLHIEPDSIERINAEFGYLITANHGLVIKEYSKAARS